MGGLGITAIDQPSHAAHQGCNLLAGSEPAAGIGFHDAHTFDAGDLGDVAPGTGAHIALGAVEAERLDVDDDVTGPGFRLWALFESQYFRPPVLLDDNGTHGLSPVVVGTGVS